MLIVLCLFLLHWFVSLFCQTFFLHRYCSHGMFLMNRFWERIFYLLTYISQGPSFLNPRSYSILHQRHHAYSDTPKDPHTPTQFRTVVGMMLKTYKEYKTLLKTNYETFKDDVVKFKSPVWPWLDKFAETKISTLMFGAIYIGIYLYFDLAWYCYFFLPVHFLIGPIQGALVNWFGHSLGYRNFQLSDKSKNTLPIDFALLGELYQNNHHKFCHRMNFAHRWFEIDVTYQISKVLSFFRIIRMAS